MFAKKLALILLVSFSTTALSIDEQVWQELKASQEINSQTSAQKLLIYLASLVESGYLPVLKYPQGGPLMVEMVQMMNVRIFYLFEEFAQNPQQPGLLGQATHDIEQILVNYGFMPHEYLVSNYELINEAMQRALDLKTPSQDACPSLLISESIN